MRFFEIFLLALLVLACLRLVTRLQGSRWLDLLLVLALLLTAAIHLIVEGARWQMLPIYVLAGIAVVYSGTRVVAVAPTLPPWPGWVGLLLAAIFALPPVLFPVLQLPSPSGPYAIGTQTFYWVDQNRTDPYSGGPRRLMVQVWYPAVAGSKSTLAPYFDHLEIGGPVIASQFKLPSFALSHLNLTRTHAYTGAAPAQGGAFPVLFFSHGWTGIREQNTFQVEDLVSQGYIVIAADHTYAAAYTVFPDGTVALNRPDALPKDAPSDVYDKAARLVGDTFVGDLRFLMDQAGRLNSGEIPSSLQGQLDLERMGVFGHSTGGGAAVATCAEDARCKAGLSMDAWLVPYDPAITQQGLKQPFMFMQSQLWSAKGNLPLQLALYDNMKGPAYRVIILGTGHYDFSDLPLLTPLASSIGLKGPLPSEKADLIIKTYTLAFFDRVFKNKFTTLLQTGGNPFPEVTFSAK